MTKQTAKGYAQLVLIIIFLVCIYLLNFGLHLLKTDPKIKNQSQEDIIVTSIPIKAENQKLSFQEVAKISVRSYIPIMPEAMGRISYVADNFKTGSCFKKNQILFKIDPDDAKADYDTALAEYQQAQANFALIQAEADAAITEWKILNPDKPIPDLVAQKPQLAQAKATLKAAKARLTLTKVNLSDTKFSFPFDGCVESSNVEIGQFATVGQPLGQVFSYDALEATVSLPISKTEQLSEIPYDITLTLDDKSYTAKIDRMTDVIDNDTQLRTVILKAENAKDLQPNRVGTAKFTTQKALNIFALTDSDIVNDTQIRIVNPDNTVSFKEINIISRTDSQIYAEAFADSINVIRGSYYGLKDGMQVKVK